MCSNCTNLKVLIQYFIPKHLISRLVGKIASAKLGKFSHFLIKTFIKYYNVNLDEAEIKDINKFDTFNDFFTRSLQKKARPIASDKKALTLPADGTISEFGKIDQDAILQAKGHYYSLNALLGNDDQTSLDYQSGSFITTYLSPSDYHRVHMPYDGKLTKMIFVPGSLFSVNPLTAQNIDNLFSKNERVICFFENEKLGSFAVILVGATIVASIETVFSGIVAPSNTRKTTIYDYKKDNIILKKGEELGRFLLGSTVICIFKKNKIEFSDNLKTNQKVKMGNQFAEIKD